MDASRLRADCERCLGLCCVAPALTQSADFALEKPAGTPCPNLQPDCRCAIHPRLRQLGFAGCAAYDCFGAGQRVCTETFAGTDWRDSAVVAGRMFEAYALVRRLHELLWHLDEALMWAPSRPLRPDLEAAMEQTERMAGLDADALLALEAGPHIHAAGQLLRRAGDRMRGALAPGGRDLAGADLIEADLAHANLAGADLRGAYLIGADLREADLTAADLLGTDLRSTDLRGARAAGALFVTRSQVHAARGDASTTLPARIDRPDAW